MAPSENIQEAVDVLQQLGLKEYEARCFVGLSQQSTGTAKQLSEITEVPRTRVYDAVRVLEAQGLVEIQHSSPRKFRAVSLSEATETLRDQYETRVDRLHDALDDIELHTADDDSSIQEVWSMTGSTGIENRTKRLLGETDSEIVFVVGDESVLTETLVDQLTGIDGEVDLLIGALTESIRAQIEDAVPGATTFVSGLEWLREEPDDTGETAIGRLVLVDRSTILVSSIVPSTGEEHAIFGEGFGNGLVVIARRLMSQGQFTASN
ncbi:TrmB family transcriptional regulator [Halohasta litorea]|uniref:TrmB family transcriptional regulator n=1 Tax=Halohasta litorea TaxID=869891 RepID=A0ABD6D7F9_9EURY|nr:helix-turn-helix domain-containing protein [Halohasta litorea]